jgi:hypothetical protein
MECLTVIGHSHVILSLDGNPDRRFSQGIEREFVGDAALAISTWLSFLARQGFRQGLLFPPLGKRIQYLGAMVPASVSAIVKRRAEQAGLDKAWIRASSLWSRRLRS